MFQHLYVSTFINGNTHKLLSNEGVDEGVNGLFREIFEQFGLFCVKLICLDLESL